MGQDIRVDAEKLRQERASLLEGGSDLLHYIAFAVIGLAVGYIVGRESRMMWIPLVLGLIGSFAGGEALRTHKYLSLLTAIVGALILGFVGRLIGGQKRR